MTRKITAVFGLVLVFALLIYPTIITAQENPITASDAGKFVGQKATVCGIVATTTFASKSKGQPTFLNLDKPYPHQLFTVLIWGSDRGKFEKPPEELSGKEICVTGMIQSYKGRPEIIVKDPSQIKVK
jgi:hypothetical protein